jgi:conjugal transfer pilus assembly protein TraI
MLSHRLLDRASQYLGLRGPEQAPDAPTGKVGSPQDLTAEGVLAPHAALVRRIRAAHGYGDRDFSRHLQAPIVALAAWVHQLPGPPGSGFERRGGAIEQALTNCLFSLQAAEGLTFEASGGEAASLPAITQGWRLACALGGLFVALPDILGRIEVVSERGDAWPSVGMPLLDWLTSLPTPKYRYRWRPVQTEPARPAVYAALRCIPPDAMSFLGRSDACIAQELLNSVAGSVAPRGQVFQLVTRVAGTVAANARREGIMPSADHLADTLRRLLGTSDWLPNAPGGHVWCGTDGMYLLWPDTAAKLLDALPGTRHSGLAASHGKLLQDLVDSGLIDATTAPLVRIRTPGQDRPRLAVRLASRHPVLGDPMNGAAQLDLGVHAQESGQITGERPALRPHADGDTGTRHADAFAMAMDAKAPPAAWQYTLDFTREPTDLDAAGEPAASVLSLDNSRITNPRIREAVDQVVARLDQSFDSMLAKLVPGGVFVALTEFVGQHGDGAAVVRALHEAQLLACNGAALDCRVTRQKVDGADRVGVVLCSTAFVGYADWEGRWHAEHAARRDPTIDGAG